MSKQRSARGPQRASVSVRCQCGRLARVANVLATRGERRTLRVRKCRSKSCNLSLSVGVERTYIAGMVAHNVVGFHFETATKTLIPLGCLNHRVVF